ncbi:hypothetical protein V492_01735 [Pseudogymnoascus sp. VKM F-4246]|nr:hypothetical protein V492_01735 [Pseudogymnoascus sp. VKM F-4246]
MRTRRPWTPEEDELLSHHVEANIGHGKLWNQVSLKLPKRTNKDCRKRWMKLGAHLKKGSWTKEEDQHLQIAVDEVGCNWTLVAGILKTRHAEQCSKRWQYHLDPSIDHTRWDTDSDKLLLRCYESHGTAWNSIKKEAFPQRSTTSIKNRCNLLLRRNGKLSFTIFKPPEIPPTDNPGPIFEGLESITGDCICPEERNRRETNQNLLSHLSTQPYVDMPSGASQQALITPMPFHVHEIPASTSMESEYDKVCWQNTPLGIGGGSIASPATSAIDHSPILVALLHQMQNQANLPALFWLNNCFLVPDPLWGGILTLEQSQAEEACSFHPQNQGLGQTYQGPSDYHRI